MNTSIIESRPDFAAIAAWIPQGSSVLDLGCGVAAEIIEFSCGGATCVGLDAAADPIKLLEFAKREFGLNSFTPVRGDAAALPFGDRSFDAVMSMHSLEHVGDLDGTLREAIRVLRPGGRLLVLQASIWNPVVVAMQWKHYGLKWQRTKHLVWRNPYGDGCDQKNEDLHDGAWWRTRMAACKELRLLNFCRLPALPGLAGVLTKPLFGHFFMVMEKI